MPPASRPPGAAGASSPGSNPEGQPPVESGGAWEYLGLGCITLVAGLFGGGMLGVLVAKIVGWAHHCASDPNTGAPCSWGTYWLFGAVGGGLIFPSTVLFLRRRGRRAAETSDRG